MNKKNKKDETLLNLKKIHFFIPNIREDFREIVLKYILLALTIEEYERFKEIYKLGEVYYTVSEIKNIKKMTKILENLSKK